MARGVKTEAALRAENAELRARLEEAEATLHAIRGGEVDALVVGGQVYILESADAAANRFRGEVLAQVNDAIIAVDNEQRLTYLNPAAERQYGVSASEALGRVLDEVLNFRWLHPDDEAAAQAALQATGVWRGENLHTKRSGEELRVESTVNVLRDGEGAAVGLLAIIRDITERKRSEVRLRESEVRFAKAFSASPLVLSISSLKTGKLMEVNDTFVNVTGFSREEAIGRTTSELGLWAEPQEREEELAQLRQFGQVRNAEYLFRVRNGTEIIGLLSAEQIELGGEPCALTVIQDITERKRVEAELRESEQQLRTLADTIPQLAWMTHADGSVFWYNQRWYDYTGTTFAEMEGWGWQAVHEPTILPRVLKRWRATLESGEPFEMEFPLRGADGQFRWFLTRGNPLRDSRGRIVRWFGTSTDIDEQRRTNEELREANRLKDEFLATVSHELRTPLTAILGWARLLGDGKLDAASTARALETIERNAKSQSQLIEDILDVSRIITGKLKLEVQPVDLTRIIEAALDAVLPAADAKGIQLQRVLDAGGSMVAGDPARLQQIVWNLLSNAIKFTQRDGRVRIQLERAGSHVEIIVADNGQGISPDILPHIFERFRQADSSTTRMHGGLGLGLAIVRHLVEMHGGTVEAESGGDGQGATFTVRFPLVALRSLDLRREGEDARVHPTAGAAVPFNCLPELEGLRLLVVDDEEDTRTLLKTVLERCGAVVVAVGSASEALATLKEMRPDVLISDLGMPVEDGYELIRKVRRLPVDEGGRTPSAALTAYARLEDRMKVLRSGFQIHLPKPVEPAELIAVVANLAGRTIK